LTKEFQSFRRKCVAVGLSVFLLQKRKITEKPKNDAILKTTPIVLLGDGRML